AAAEFDRAAAALVPRVHAAVENGSRVDAVRGENARGDRGARAGVADRDDRLLADTVAAHPQQAIGDVARARDVAAVALVLLTYVEHLDLAGREQPLHLVQLDRGEALLGGRVKRVAAYVEQPDRTQSPCRALRLRHVDGVNRNRLVRRE